MAFLGLIFAGISAISITGVVVYHSVKKDIKEEKLNDIEENKERNFIINRYIDKVENNLRNKKEKYKLTKDYSKINSYQNLSDKNKVNKLLLELEKRNALEKELRMVQRKKDEVMYKKEVIEKKDKSKKQNTKEKLDIQRDKLQKELDKIRKEKEEKKNKKEKKDKERRSLSRRRRSTKPKKRTSEIKKESEKISKYRMEKKKINSNIYIFNILDSIKILGKTSDRSYEIKSDYPINKVNEDKKLNPEGEIDTKLKLKNNIFKYSFKQDDDTLYLYFYKLNDTYYNLLFISYNENLIDVNKIEEEKKDLDK